MEQDEYRYGEPCEGEGQRDTEEHKGGKKQEDEEIGGDMCPGCDRE